MMQTNKEALDGIQWRINQRLNDLDYTKELCLMSHTFFGIKQKLDCLAVNAKKEGLKIYVGKTKLLGIDTVCLTPLMYNDIQIKDVNEFCYLGSIVAENGGT
jgi:hypothetical protein